MLALTFSEHLQYGYVVERVVHESRNDEVLFRACPCGAEIQSFVSVYSFLFIFEWKKLDLVGLRLDAIHVGGDPWVTTRSKEIFADTEDCRVVGLYRRSGNKILQVFLITDTEAL